MRVRAKRFSPGLVLRSSILGAETGGVSVISAVGGGVGVLVAAIVVLLELFASEKSNQFFSYFGANNFEFYSDSRFVIVINI